MRRYNAAVMAVLWNGILATLTEEQPDPVESRAGSQDEGPGGQMVGLVTGAGMRGAGDAGLRSGEHRADGTAWRTLPATTSTALQTVAS